MYASITSEWSFTGRRGVYLSGNVSTRARKEAKVPGVAASWRLQRLLDMRQWWAGDGIIRNAKNKFSVELGDEEHAKHSPSPNKGFDGAAHGHLEVGDTETQRLKLCVQNLRASVAGVGKF
jgi:hypothetical protein